MYKALYTKKALGELKKLPLKTAQRIVKKVEFFSEQKDPLKHAKQLTNSLYGEYRFRVGDYRVIFDKDEKGNLVVLYILSVKHRKDSYR